MSLPQIYLTGVFVSYGLVFAFAFIVAVALLLLFAWMWSVALLMKLGIMKYPEQPLTGPVRSTPHDDEKGDLLLIGMLGGPLIWPIMVCILIWAATTMVIDRVKSGRRSFA